MITKCLHVPPKTYPQYNIRHAYILLTSDLKDRPYFVTVKTDSMLIEIHNLDTSELHAMKHNTIFKLC